MTLSACSEWGPHENVASPSDDPALAATIRPPLLQTVGNPNLVDQPTFACSQGLQFTGPLDIAMTAGQDVDLNQVAIRLVDGMLTLDVNTFSHEDLTEGFGTTEILSGTIGLSGFTRGSAAPACASRSRWRPTSSSGKHRDARTASR